MRTYILEGWEDPFIQSRSVEIAFILIFEDQHPDIQLHQNDLLVINVGISFESTIYLSLSLSLSLSHTLSLDIMLLFNRTMIEALYIILVKF